MSVTPVVPYLFTGLAGCSVDPGISRGARKLVQIPRVIKKNTFRIVDASVFFFFFANKKQYYFNKKNIESLI
jgi:hypothetical protein